MNSNTRNHHTARPLSSLVFTYIMSVQDYGRDLLAYQIWASTLAAQDRVYAHRHAIVQDLNKPSQRLRGSWMSPYCPTLPSLFRQSQTSHLHSFHTSRKPWSRDGQAAQCGVRAIPWRVWRPARARARRQRCHWGRRQHTSIICLFTVYMGQAVAESSATDADTTSHAAEDSAAKGRHSTRTRKKLIHLNLVERRTTPY